MGNQMGSYGWLYNEDGLAYSLFIRWANEYLLRMYLSDWILDVKKQRAFWAPCFY